MRSMRFYVASVALFLATCLLACSEASQGGSAAARTASSARSVLLQREFADSIARCEFITFDTMSGKVSGFERSMVSRMRSSIGKEIPLRELTPGEQRRLGVWRLPGGQKVFWQQIIWSARDYREKHGVLPDTGVDLFPDLENGTKMLEVSTMNEDDLLSAYALGIDPITGRFYANLHADKWAPAAMHLSVVDDPVQLKKLFPNLQLPVTKYVPGAGVKDTGEYKGVAEAWYITIYGEAPGSVLYDGVIWM